MGAWVIGRNLVGYLPEWDTMAFAEWQDAATMLTEEMKEYADGDDENVGLSEDDYDNDLPVMRATVDAILKDDGPAKGQDFSAIVEDNDGRQLAFWLQWTEDREPSEQRQ